MNEYRRPTIPVEIYRDELGTPIDYGNRWGGACAPEDAYSRVSNLQRFAPLHAVAMALIEWLQDTFDVTLAQGPSVASDLLRMPHEVISAVRVVPREPAAAPLTFVLTQFPGVYTFMLVRSTTSNFPGAAVTPAMTTPRASRKNSNGPFALSCRAAILSDSIRGQAAGLSTGLMSRGHGCTLDAAAAVACPRTG